ncbi:MAG TPA: rhomboid family intramembrane serine protease [Opitutaceae bacterium]
MNPETPAAPFRADATFPVSYQAFAGREFNRELKGSGTLELQREPVKYRFTGQRRGLLFGRTGERDFDASGILNVTLEGRKIRFMPARREGGGPEKPFVFFARDASSAREIASVLPHTVDSEFVAVRDFGQRMRQMPGGSHPLLSVTGIIVGLNVAVFLVMAVFMGAGWVESSDMAPYIRAGASNAAATTDGQWWRLVASMFIHFGILHLALNMWALLQSGTLVERLQGRTLYAITYLASGLGGGFLSMAWHGDKIWSAGASGAIFGVYGALLGYMLREKKALPKSVFQPLLKSTLIFAGYNLVYGLSNPRIDNGAHVGGLLTGIAMGWLTAPPLDPDSRSRLMASRIRLAVTATLALVVVGVSTAKRYDYSATEELALDNAIRDFGTQSQAIVEQQNASVTEWTDAKGPGADLRSVVVGKLVPFYTSFAATLDGLHVKPGSRTERRRRALSEYAHFNLESFDHLLLAINARDSNDTAALNRELAAFSERMQKAGQAVQPYNAPDAPEK